MPDLATAFEAITVSAATFGRQGNVSEPLVFLQERFGAGADQQGLCRDLVLALHREGFVLKVNKDGSAVYDPERRHKAFYFVPSKGEGTVSFHVNQNDSRLPLLRAWRSPVRQKRAEWHIDVGTSADVLEVLALMRRGVAGRPRPLF
jgi:hypothetical protein